MLTYILKSILLILSILIVLPIIFFVLIKLLGKYFYLNIEENSWLAGFKFKK